MSLNKIIVKIKTYIKGFSGRKHSSMANVFDVAAYILEKIPGEMPTWKLQKLVYYCQAWHLVWEDKPLFPEKIEAWVAGPVVPILYNLHKGKFSIARKDLKLGDSKNLIDCEKQTIDMVLDEYAKFSGFQLSELSHNEMPWQEARKGYKFNESCHNEITLENMAEFYSSLA